MNTNKQSLLNLGLRGLSMGARFLLVFCMGKYFATETLGLYGIFFTTITLGIFALGFDFYTFSNREILYVKEEEKLSVLRNQLLFYGITYLIFLLPLLLLFFYKIIPTEYIYLFYIILIFEHLSQEFYRLYTVLSYPVFANWILFLRTGIWIYILIAYYFFVPLENYSLYPILIGWAVGAGISVIIGFVKILKLYKKYKLSPLDWKWFKTGLNISLFYFISTVALKIIEFANRYMLEYWCGLKSVGIFTFYSQIANMVNVVIFTLFIMIIYPKIITAVTENNIAEYNYLKLYMAKKIRLYSILLSILMGIFIFPLLYVINKNEYYHELPTFYILIISNIFLNISLVYHYVLYAFKKDKLLLYSTVVGMILSFVFNLVLIQHFAALGASVSIALSYFGLMVAKFYFSRKVELAFINQ